MQTNGQNSAQGDEGIKRYGEKKRYKEMSEFVEQRMMNGRWD